MAHWKAFVVQLSTFAWKLLLFTAIFANLWTFFDSEALPPNGTYFHLLMIFIAAHVCAKVSDLCNLPPLFGMLVAGFAYGNVFDIDLDKKLTSMLRSLALMIILLRAGLSLDPVAIKQLSFVCFRLAFGPCLVETITVAIVAHFLFSLNLAWSLMLGFVLAAVSPAVVVPGMLKMIEKKLGVRKGIPTLIIAAASIDDVLAITGFSVCLSFAFSSRADDSSSETWKLVMSILKGPFEAAVGIAYGLLFGTLLWYIPERCHTVPKSSSLSTSKTKCSKYDLHRLAILLLLGVFALFGSQKFDFGGAGPLAILVLSFVASLRWRPGGYDLFSEESLKTLWTIFQHFLFCLIGADVRIKSMQSSVLLYGFLTLLIGLAFRLAAAFLLTYGNGLTLKERLFTAIAWLPKATVQAAIGSVALDQSISHGAKRENIEHGQLVLTIAVLSILLTAPLGAIAIDWCSQVMLTADDADGHEDGHPPKDEDSLVDVELKCKHSEPV